MASTPPLHPLLALTLFAPLLSACGGDDDPGTSAIGAIHQVSYEVIPTPLYELGALDLTLENASYAQREAFTVEIQRAILPDLIAAVGLSDQMLDTELTPGGFQLVTNPSLQSRLMATDTDAEALAAGIGYVFSQWSVLVTDFSDTAGDTGFAVVSFDVAHVDPELGQHFFEHAASIDGGLGGGYFAFEREVIYLNLRDPVGAPYSGLEDPQFVSMLEHAAASFAPYKAELAQSGAAGVLFVENDWTTAPGGEDYLDILADLDDPQLAQLADLRAEHTDRFVAAAAANAWN